MSINKQDIVVSAYTDFYNNGFNASGVESLAKQAGITKRTLYAHFGNKEGLIRAVLKYRDMQFTQKLEEFFANNKEQSVIDTYLKFISEWMNENNFNGCLFINASAEFHGEPEELSLQISAHKAKVRKFLCERMMEEGKKNVELLSEVLFLVGEGMIVARQTGQGDIGQDWSEIANVLKEING